jgi:hypothetical protein
MEIGRICKDDLYWSFLIFYILWLVCRTARYSLTRRVRGFLLLQIAVQTPTCKEDLYWSFLSFFTLSLMCRTARYSLTRRVIGISLLQIAVQTKKEQGDWSYMQRRSLLVFLDLLYSMAGMYDSSLFSNKEGERSLTPTNCC